MTSSQYTMYALLCDRCGLQTDTVSDQSWGEVRAQRRHGSAIIPSFAADLCPMCVGSLRDWFDEHARKTGYNAPTASVSTSSGSGATITAIQKTGDGHDH
jgi:hypothetical protein